MSLLSTYQRLQRGLITEAQACEEFGITERNLKFKITKYGKRLPLVLRTLDEIHDDDLSREKAAERLQVTARQVNNMMTEWKIVRPLKEYVITRAVSKVKWEIRKKYAIEFISGACTLEEAAENAEVSDRQMRRWVSDLLKKHYEIVFKDLKLIADSRRQRMADEIEEAEGLEIAKQNVLRQVSKGEKAIEEVALERVLSKRSTRRSRHVRGKP